MRQSQLKWREKQRQMEKKKLKRSLQLKRKKNKLKKLQRNFLNWIKRSQNPSQAMRLALK